MGQTTSHKTRTALTPASDGNLYTAKFRKQPFATGRYRVAFQGKFCGTGKQNGHKCVVKVYSNRSYEKWTDWKPDLKLHREAMKYAQLFNREVCGGELIIFLQPVIASVAACAQFNLFGCVPLLVYDEHLSSDNFVSVEQYIPGSFAKFNSNTGFDSGLSELLSAFSHYTYVRSHGQLLVCDLQGSQSGPGYLLTDPAINSRFCSYGPTDLGVLGMADFFSTHCCNRFCRSLPQPEQCEHVCFRSRCSEESSYSSDLSDNELQVNERFSSRGDLPLLVG